MKPFRLRRPRDLDQALEALAANPAESAAPPVRVLAGGQDLLTEMKEHLVEAEELVDLTAIPGLNRIEADADGTLRIGALATIAALARDARVARDLGVLGDAARSIASPQIRAVGTVGGNLCQRPRCWYYRHAEAPCLKKGGSECFSYAGRNKYNAILGGGPTYIVHPSDLAPALVALDAEVVLRSAAGERRMPLERFYVLPSEGAVERETVLANGEVLVEVRVPPPAPGMRSAYLKFKERPSFDWALAAVALCLWHDGTRIERARVVLGGVAPVPWRARHAEELLAGAALEPKTFEAAGTAALRGAEPLSENAYKIPLTEGLVFRALERLAPA